VWLEIAGAEDRLVSVVVALEPLLLVGTIDVGRGLIEPMSGAFVGEVVVAVVGFIVTETAGVLEDLTTAELGLAEAGI